MVELFPNEKLELSLSPCKLAWIGYYLKGLSYFLLTLLILWFSQSQYMPSFMEWIGYQNAYILILVIWSLAIIGLNLLYSIHHIKLGYLLGALAIIGGFALIIYEFNVVENWQSILLAYTIVISILLLIVADLSRISHLYLLTDKRVVVRGGILKKDERELGYEAITDLGFKQGLFGRLFNYGNLTPVTQSGMGIETKTTGAGGGVLKNIKSWAFFGVFGGAKTTQEIGGRTYYILFGVKPFKLIRELVERHRYERSTATQQEKQIELTQQMAENIGAVRQRLAPRILFCPLKNTEVEEIMCERCPNRETCEAYLSLKKVK
jgi:membrane protein YdbS with pleckstrin-like domain